MKEITDTINSLSERPTLDSYLTRYMRGEQLSEADLTSEVMKKLWADELVGDRYISFIFNTPITRVRELRDGYGLKHKQYVHSCAAQYGAILGEIGSSIMMM